MLNLTRRIGESIIIGDQITITIFDIDGQSVRVGIEAPRDISVHREEAYQRIADSADGVGYKPVSEGDYVRQSERIRQ